MSHVGSVQALEEVKFGVGISWLRINKHFLNADSEARLSSTYWQREKELSPTLPARGSQSREEGRRGQLITAARRIQ